jgi:hypothetical protein
MNNSEEISIISKLVLQQIGLLDSLTDCQKLKKDLINQAIELLKAITIKSGGVYVLEKEFKDSASDNSINLTINPQENGDIILEIEETNEE